MGSISKIVITLFLCFAFSINLADAGTNKEEPLIWGYEGGTGPEHWGKIEKDHEQHETCRDGQLQSPIDIEKTTKPSLSSLQFHYSKTPLRILHNEHTIQLTYDPGSYVVWGDKKFNLIQLHFHIISEHTVLGKHYDMEMHLVHKTSDHHYAVIAVLMKAGNNHPFFEKLWSQIPEEIDKEVHYPGEWINAEHFLPDKKSFYHYYGSLTTPPCSENVSWFILTDPDELSANQITRFQHFIKHNNRPIQPLNERVIERVD